MFNVCLIIAVLLLLSALVIRVVSNVIENRKEADLCQRDEDGIKDAASRYRHKHPKDKK